MDSRRLGSLGHAKKGEDGRGVRICEGAARFGVADRDGSPAGRRRRGRRHGRSLDAPPHALACVLSRALAAAWLTIRARPRVLRAVGEPVRGGDGTRTNAPDANRGPVFARAAWARVVCAPRLTQSTLVGRSARRVLLFVATTQKEEALAGEPAANALRRRRCCRHCPHVRSVPPSLPARKCRW